MIFFFWFDLQGKLRQTFMIERQLRLQDDDDDDEAMVGINTMMMMIIVIGSLNNDDIKGKETQIG